MVETGRKPNPLIDQVFQQNKAQEAQRQSEVQAKQMLPDFKTQLGGLITTKVPAPEVIIEQVTRFNYRDDMDDFRQSRRKRQLKTKLTAAIPLEDGEVVKVTISASAYPEADNPGSAKSLDYQVDVEDLGKILIIEGSQAILQSKRWESEHLTIHTPIGVPLPNWPAWEHPVRAEDIQEYQALLESLNQEGVTFEGSTPPIINRDYSEMRAQIKLPNAQQQYRQSPKKQRYL